ncbi:MAG: hypothetical protein HN350_02095 [Phycisphaerales bacterium]|nr:hypothetical protein [Phycisphaerales bacterium]
MTQKTCRVIIIGAVVLAAINSISKLYINSTITDEFLLEMKESSTRTKLLQGAMLCMQFQVDQPISNAPIQIPQHGPLYALFRNNNFTRYTNDDADYKLLDGWKTPIHFISEGNELTLYSFGPNKADNKGAEDDIVYDKKIEIMLDHNTETRPSTLPHRE